MWRVRKQIACDDKLHELYSGKNISVAVLDTGIFFHPDFAGRIVAFRDFVNGREKPYDDCGHGTHVTGCVAGDGYLSGGKYRGVAPACQIISGKILDKNGEGSVEQMLSGIQWIIENRKTYNIRILNISIGFEEEAGEKKLNRLADALEEAWKHKILVVAAAGNKGPAARSLSSLAVSPHILTVGCHDLDYYKEGVTPCESYSGRGPGNASLKKPDLVAPGTNIFSTCHQCRRQGDYYEDAYESKSGTSFATPLVSGGAALLMEKEPELSPEEVKHRLCYSATDLGEPWNKQGWGMMNLRKALHLR